MSHLHEIHHTTESLVERMRQVPVGNRSRAGNVGGDFTVTDWNGALGYIENGYREVTGEISQFSDKLTVRMSNERPGLDSIKYGEEGDWVDIDRYLNKEYDECFVELVEGNPKPIRSLNIIVNISANAYVRSSALMMRGAAISYLCDYFRRIGINIDLWVVDYSDQVPNHGAYADITALFKIDTNEGFSVNQLASYVALPDFLRRISFAISELLTDQQHCGSYGRAGDLIENGKLRRGVPRAVEDALGGPDAIANALYFGRPENDWESFEWTVKEICRIIDEFNTKHGGVL